MPYVQRDLNGKLIGSYACFQAGYAEEFLPDGSPDLLPPWAPIKAAEIATYIETREKMCARVAGIGQRLARAGDAAGAASCDDVVNALLDVPSHTSVTGATDLAALKLALKTRYQEAVALASVSAKAEFRRYDK